MGAVAEVELGLTEDLRIGFGDEQPGHPERLFLGASTDDDGDPLGFGFPKLLK